MTNRPVTQCWYFSGWHHSQQHLLLRIVKSNTDVNPFTLTFWLTVTDGENQNHMNSVCPGEIFKPGMKNAAVWFLECSEKKLQGTEMDVRWRRQNNMDKLVNNQSSRSSSTDPSKVLCSESKHWLCFSFFASLLSESVLLNHLVVINNPEEPAEIWQRNEEGRFPNIYTDITIWLIVSEQICPPRHT